MKMLCLLVQLAGHGMHGIVAFSTHYQLPTTLRSSQNRIPLAIVLKADEEDDDLLASLRFALRKPGEGPMKEGSESLPIRKGGSMRDGSLGELRAARQALPENFLSPGPEEVGLVAFFVFLIGSFVWGYFTYVN